MGKKSFSRESAEMKEGLDIVKNDVPENRLQADQQVADVQSAQDTKPEGSTFTMHKTKAKGNSLKQSIISDAITGASSTSGMGINAAGRGVSGTAGGILGAANSTPEAGKSRSDSRTGKKLDRIGTKLNYTPSEQVLIDVDESAPLADSADVDQGYNGTYRNEFARSQKVAGAVPADLMFQRSVDFIIKDKLYFVEGQQIFQGSTALGDERFDVNPSRNYNDETKTYENIRLKSGNYLHRNLHVGIGNDGKVRSLFFDVEDLTTNLSINPEDVNCASAHRIIKENVAELDRMTMDAKAGDEKADLWTPLARAIEQPTRMSYFLSSMEAETGAYVHLAYSKATTNMAFQLNRGPKDGLDVITPAIEQCVGWRDINTDSANINTAYSGDLANVFTQANYRLGDPSLMIDVYDSVNKYKNKADLLLQPRGWRMHLQTADNNMNPLKVTREYAQVFAGQEVYSTIDHEYDPVLPICMTDKANLITVHNFNELCAFITQRYTLSLSATSIDSKYYYRDLTVIPAGFAKATNYEYLYIYEHHTAGDGFAYNSTTGVISMDPDSTNADRVCTLYVSTRTLTSDELGDGGDFEDYTLLATIADNNANDIIFHCPVVQAAASGNGNTVVTIADLVEQGQVKYKYAGHLRYKYSDLRNNYVVTVKHPLVYGIMEYLNDSIGGAIRKKIGQERFDVPLIFSTHNMTLAQLLICAATPWITRVRMNTMRDVIYYEDNVGQYPYQKLTSLKDTPFKNYVNFGYAGYDEPLTTKVLDPAVAIQWIMPEFFWNAGSKVVLPWYFNENDLNDDGTVNEDANNMSMPSIRSGIRLGLLDTLYGLSEKDIRLSLDRMTKTFMKNTKINTNAVGVYKYGRTTDGQPFVTLGAGDVFSLYDVLSAPRELGLCMDAPLGLLTRDPADGGSLKSMTADGTLTSYRIIVYVNKDTKLHPTILDADGVNIRRGANYTQKWYSLFANGATEYTDVAGLVFGLNDEGDAVYSPFANLGRTADPYATSTDVVSYQRSLWTRIQMLPFVISPYDALKHEDGVLHDIYDFAYMFGLCGFRASDYRESVYNREKEVVNQGLLFVDDPWIVESSIIKNGASHTGVSITKGYELSKK